MRAVFIASFVVVTSYSATPLLCGQGCSTYNFRMTPGAEGGAMEVAGDFLAWKGGDFAACEQLRGRIQAALQKRLSAANELERQTSLRLIDAQYALYDSRFNNSSAQTRANLDAASAAAQNAKDGLRKEQGALSQFPRRCECVGSPAPATAEQQGKIQQAESRAQQLSDQAARATTSVSRTQLTRQAEDARREVAQLKQAAATPASPVSGSYSGGAPLYSDWVSENLQRILDARQAQRDLEKRNSGSALSAMVDPGFTNAKATSSRAGGTTTTSSGGRGKSSNGPLVDPGLATSNSNSTGVVTTKPTPVASGGSANGPTSSSVSSSKPTAIGSGKSSPVRSTAPAKAPSAAVNVSLTTQNLKSSVEKRLTVLTALRKDNDAAFDEALRAVEQDHKEMMKKVNTVDSTAQGALIVVSVGQMARKGLQSVGANAEELARITADIRKDLTKLSALPVPLPSGDNVIQNAWASSMKAWSDLHSPSYWATFLTKWSDDSRSWSDPGRLWAALEAASLGPAGLLSVAKARIEAQRKQTNQLLDARIAETRALLSGKK